MKKTIVFAMLFGILALAQAVAAPNSYGPPAATQNAPYWVVALGANQSLSGSTVIHFDTVGVDPKSVCNTSSTWVCTPLVAGTYYISCQLDIQETTGPAAGNNAIAQVSLTVNGTIVSENYLTAQVSSLASPVAMVNTARLVKLNGSTDNVGCKGSSDGTTAQALGSTTRTFMLGYRTGAQ